MVSNGRSPGREASGEVDYNERFAKMIAEHGYALRMYCRTFARDADEEDDLVQSTWVLAWQHRTKYRGEGSMGGWLTRLARTVCLRCAAERRTFVDLAALPPIETSSSMSAPEASERQEFDDQLLSAVLALPLRRRQVVLLRLLGGLDTKETAEVLRCSTGTVKAALHQAIQSLRGRQCVGTSKEA